MAIISDKLNKILSAVFGKDVRQALYDGLDAINKETESTTSRQDYLDRKYDEQIKNMTLQDPSSAEIVDMRVAPNGKTFEKAGDRLNYFDEQLDNKANAVDVYNKNEINTKIWNMTNLGQDIKEAMTGGSVAVVGKNTVLNVNIVDNQIMPNKLGFGKVGKNKFDGTFLTNTTLSGDGSDGTFTVNNSSGGVCAIVRVIEGTTYTISVEEGHDRFRVGECADYPEYGAKVTKRHFADADNKVTLQVREGMSYFIIYLSSPSQGLVPSQLQVEEGTKQTSYSKPTLILDYETNTIPQSAIIKEQYSIGLQLGIKFDISLINKTVTVADLNTIIVTEKDRYFINGGTYSYADIEANSICILANRNTKELEFCKTSEMIYKTEEYAYIGIINRNTEQIDINGNYSLEGKSAITYTGQSGDSSNNQVKHIINISNENYNVISENITNTSLLLDCTKVYAKYDELMAKYPDYITRTLLGNEYTGLPIYRYDFKPPLPQNNALNTRLPKIFISSNIHGNETLIMTNHIRFFTDICESWRTNSDLEALRWGVHFIVVPVANPWGYNNNSRKNSRGVDLNRNFASGWDELIGDSYTNPESLNYKGESAMSEIETQIYNAVTDEVGIDFLIDCHNFNTFDSDGHVVWFGSNKENVHKLLFNTANIMTSKFKKDYSYMPQDNTNLVMIKGATNGGVIKHMESKGLNASIFEAVWKMKDNGQDTQKATTESLGNLILNAVRNINNI